MTQRYTPVMLVATARRLTRAAGRTMLNSDLFENDPALKAGRATAELDIFAAMVGAKNLARIPWYDAADNFIGPA